MASLIDFLCCALAILVGGVIGLGFGTLQDAAHRRHIARERQNEFKNAWTVMPGSGARIAYLLIALTLIQVGCPMLFANSTQWWVSGGVVAGYGWPLLQRLRRERAAAR